jgi:environmental stress-induced protein Ves
MRILRASDHKVMPWKNGLGATTEIAVSPEHDGFEAFAWRVSMAQVTRDGPFSLFPGVDRTLLVLTGNGIVLDVDGRQPATLTRDSAPYPFAGDATTKATLIDGPIVDLNVMVRRGVVRADVQRIQLTAPQQFIATDIRLLFVESGESIVRSTAGDETLLTNDALLFDTKDAPLQMRPCAAATLVSIEMVFAKSCSNRF